MDFLKNSFFLITELFKIIKINGINICLKWTHQIITNQIAKSLVEVHHKYYIIHYPYGMTWYKIIVPRNRKPLLIETIYSGENDVTEDVLKYLGPSYNFHGQNIRPIDIGYKSLKFVFTLGETKFFDEFDNISLL
jgi:hypothetical protein